MIMEIGKQVVNGIIKDSSLRPAFDYSKSSNNQNLTRLIMNVTNDFFEAQRTLKAILSVSPEPRIYKYSRHKETEKLMSHGNI